MADFVRVPKADWQDILDATREQTGGTEKLLSGEVAPAVRGIQSGGGEEWFVCLNSGAYYKAHMEYPENCTKCPNFEGSGKLISIISYFTGTFGGAWFRWCPNLETAIFPYTTGSTRDWQVFRECLNLKNAQLGSVGYPVTSLIGNFNLCTQSDLVITVYVNATTLAEIPTEVIGNAPFGATNATILYRNSTTGEVITE